jgi:hypothetical protein
VVDGNFENRSVVTETNRCRTPAGGERPNDVELAAGPESDALAGFVRRHA